MKWFRKLTVFNRVVVLVTLAWAVIIVSADYLFEFDLTAADKVLAIVPLVTAAAIIIFTAETFELKKVQQEQLDYENRPYFRIQWSNNEYEVLKIVNIGKGIAVDATFEAVRIEDVIPFTIAIKKRPAFSVGGVSAVTVEELREKSGKDERFGIRGYLKAKIKKGDFPQLHMVYMDLRGQVYEAKFEADESYNDRFKIVSQGKRK